MPPLIENAARSGLVLACFVLACLVLSSMGGFLGLVGIATGFAGMTYLMRQQRLRDRESRLETGRGVPGAALVSYGIAIAFFGALPVALAVYVALRFIWPDYIVHQLEGAVAIMAPIPEYAAMTAQLQAMLEHGPVPTAADMMASMLTLMMVMGLGLGLAGALTAKIVNRKWT